MKKLLLAQLVLACCASASAADYVLSADGGSVVRLVPQGTVTAASIDTGLLNAGWTSSSGTGGSMSVSSYIPGYKNGVGGAEIKALYSNGAALPAGSSLEWVQVIKTNVTLGGASSPYLDNAGKPGQPFYTLTAQNRNGALPPNKLNFYDFSKRDPATIPAGGAITWNASLYPVVWDGNKGLSVKDGVSWGWTMKKAMVGTDSSVFINPGPPGATVGGVGTSTFSWGQGDPSSINFASVPFDAKPGVPFKLGRLTFHNGAIAANTGASSVDMKTSMSFTNVPEKNTSFVNSFGIINTANSDDPIASADYLSIGGFNYTFNVLEDATASVDIMATLSTGLSPIASGAIPTGAELDNGTPFDPTGGYALTIVGLTNPSDGGFVVPLPVPEPSTLAMLLAGVAICARRIRKAA